MKTTIFVTLILLLTACNDKTESNTTETQEVQVENTEVKEVPTNASRDILSKLGLDINNGKITIDMNRTTEFMQKMEIEMHGKADEIERKIERADINFSEGFGFQVEGEKVAIDLNKTKDMLQQINILMKDILLDVNSTVH